MNTTIRQGQVVAILPDENEEKELLVVKNGIETVYIPEEEVNVSNAINFIGTTVVYECTDYQAGRQYASIKQTETKALTQLKADYEADPMAQYEAEVVMVENDHARLRINHCLVRLERFDYVQEAIILPELIRVGDRFPVRIKLIHKDYVQVEAVHLQTRPHALQLSDLQEGDLVYGVVNRTKIIRKKVEDSLEKSHHVFINIADGIDALAPLQSHRPAEAGQIVVAKLNQVNADGRVRGKLLRILKHPLKPINPELNEGESEIGTIRTGWVKLIRDDYELGEKVLVVDCQNEWVTVPVSELSPYDGSRTDLGWIGRQIKVQITHTSPRLLGSKRQADQLCRRQFIEEWQSNPSQVKSAYLNEVGSLGYILNIGQEEVYLLKSDYRASHPEMPDPQPHEKLFVQLKHVQGDVINVLPGIPSKEQTLSALGLTEEQLQTTPKEELPLYPAQIVKLMKKGAYLMINDIRVYLPNMLFSLGKTRVKDVHRVGDWIRIRPQNYRDHRLVVSACPRLVDEEGLLPEEIEVGMLAYGIVRKINPGQHPETGEPQAQVFTSIGFKLEGLSPASQYFEVEEGDPVIFRIHQIRENGSIRGKIVRPLPRFA